MSPAGLCKAKAGPIGGTRGYYRRLVPADGKEHRISSIGLGYMGLGANYNETEPDDMREAEL
jgi:hypothetical protein